MSEASPFLKWQFLCRKRRALIYRTVARLLSSSRVICHRCLIVSVEFAKRKQRSWVKQLGERYF
jgi:hypothetical protein